MSSAGSYRQQGDIDQIQAGRELPKQEKGASGYSNALLRAYDASSTKVPVSRETYYKTEVLKVSGRHLAKVKIPSSNVCVFGTRTGDRGEELECHGSPLPRRCDPSLDFFLSIDTLASSDFSIGPEVRSDERRISQVVAESRGR